MVVATGLDTTQFLTLKGFEIGYLAGDFTRKLVSRMNAVFYQIKNRSFKKKDATIPILWMIVGFHEPLKEMCIRYYSIKYVFCFFNSPFNEILKNIFWTVYFQYDKESLRPLIN